MLTSQQFCVKWNSYSSNLQTVFPRLLTSEHFVDITLACEGQMIKCHKVVLSACSTYFEKLLVQNPCQHPIIFMKDMKHWEVQALVDFMYKGEVNVSQEELNSLLVAAEALQIRGLCGSYSDQRQKESRPPSSPLTQLSSVSLPNDIVLSGGTTMGQDAPPQKKRKIPNDEKDQSLPTTPRISNVSSLSCNKVEQPDTNSNDQFKDTVAEEFGEEMQDKKIKQEMDIEDHYLEGEADGEGHEDDGGDIEQPDDSDSNNREEVHSNPILDQPGPSGISITGAADKSAPGRRWADPVSTMGSTEVDRSAMPSLQHLSSLSQPHLLEIPFATGWCGNVTSVKQFSNPPTLSFNRHSGELFSPVNANGQSRPQESFPLSIPLGNQICDVDPSNRVPLHHSVHYTADPSAGTSVSRYLGSGMPLASHSVAPAGSSVISRGQLVDKTPYDILLSSNPARQHRISRRRTEEEKALRKLEMARLRQRRFRAKIRLMREAGLPVIKKERKRKGRGGGGSETDNTQT